MAFAQPIRDIVCADIWIDTVDGSQVIIVTAGNKYVEFSRGAPKPEIYFIDHFRQRFVPNYSRAHIRGQFSMSLANLDSLHAFWCPVQKRLFVRSTSRSVADAYKPSRGRGGAVPKSAIYIATYTHPFPADDFLSDVDAVIAKLEVQNERANAHHSAPAWA